MFVFKRDHQTLEPAACRGARDFPLRSRIFRKRVRKVIISEVKWRDLKRGHETSKSGGKWKMGNEVNYSEVRWSEALWCNVCTISDLYSCTVYVGYCIVCCLAVFCFVCFVLLYVIIIIRFMFLLLSVLLLLFCMFCFLFCVLCFCIS